MIEAILAMASLAAGADALAARPPTDLPGITSTKALESGSAALRAPDVRLYTKIMRAAVDRYQHPTTQDSADIAEADRLHHLQALGQAAMANDFQAGDVHQASEDAFHPTARQAAALDRGDALTSTGLPEMLAREAGMPDEQWSMLRQRVEAAAGLDTHGQAPAVTVEQKARVKDLLRAESANKELVAPSAAEIRRLSNLVIQLAAERTPAAD